MLTRRTFIRSLLATTAVAPIAAVAAKGIFIDTVSGPCDTNAGWISETWAFPGYHLTDDEVRMVIGQITGTCGPRTASSVNFTLRTDPDHGLPRIPMVRLSRAELVALRRHVAA